MNLKLHLDEAESDPVLRLAAALQVKPEDVLYAALDRLMMHARARGTQRDIVRMRRARADNLPLWADSAGSVHSYEGMPPCHPEKSRYSV